LRRSSSAENSVRVILTVIDPILKANQALQGITAPQPWESLNESAHPAVGMRGPGYFCCLHGHHGKVDVRKPCGRWFKQEQTILGKFTDGETFFVYYGFVESLENDHSNTGT
jgi:hypothetical protein